MSFTAISSKAISSVLKKSFFEENKLITNEILPSL